MAAKRPLDESQSPISGADGPGAANDSELAVRAANGDQSAFAALYDRHAPLVARRLRRMLGPTPDVADVLQAIFLEVHRSLPRYRPERQFGGWLYGISLNVARSHLRSRKRRSWLQLFGKRDDSEEATAPLDLRASGIEDHIAHRALVRDICAALDDLPPKKRIAFALHELEGLELPEISKLLGATTQTVWARINSARVLVRARLSIETRSKRRQDKK